MWLLLWERLGQGNLVKVWLREDGSVNTYGMSNGCRCRAQPVGGRPKLEPSRFARRPGLRSLEDEEGIRVKLGLGHGR
jgi:hypothetical protein